MLDTAHQKGRGCPGPFNRSDLGSDQLQPLVPPQELHPPHELTESPSCTLIAYAKAPAEIRLTELSIERF